MDKKVLNSMLNKEVAELLVLLDNPKLEKFFDKLVEERAEEIANERKEDTFQDLLQDPSTKERINELVEERAHKIAVTNLKYISWCILPCAGLIILVSFLF